MKFKGDEKNTKYEGSRFEIINKIFSIEGLEISHSGVSLFYKHNEGNHDAWYSFSIEKENLFDLLQVENNYLIISAQLKGLYEGVLVAIYVLFLVNEISVEPQVADIANESVKTKLEELIDKIAN